jgi:hypothetical protein
MTSDRALSLVSQWSTEAAAIVGGKTVPAGHRHEQSDVDGLPVALQSRLSAAQLGQPNGVAPLDATGKVPVANLPDISTTRGVFPVSSQAAMLSLAAEVGAVAVRSDLGGQSFILAALPASNLSNWLSQSPPGTVISVNGQTGVVTIPSPGLATSTTDGLMSAAQYSLISGQGASTGQTLQIQGGAPVWASEQWTVLTNNATLEPNRRYLVKGGGVFTLPSTPSGVIILANSRPTSIRVNAAGSATLSGFGRNANRPINASTSVSIRPGFQGRFITQGTSWECLDCEPDFLSFTYNGTPLANNPANPLNAADLFHYLGLVQGNGTWVNPSNTAILTAATSGNETGTMLNLTDRVAGGQNVHTPSTANSWRGWQFQSPFRCTGFWIQTRSSYDSHHPRNFALKVNSGTSLTDSTNVVNWTTVQSWTNQTQITGTNQYFFFPVTNPIEGNQLALLQTGANSSGTNHFCFQEIALFGDYFE